MSKPPLRPLSTEIGNQNNVTIIPTSNEHPLRIGFEPDSLGSLSGSIQVEELVASEQDLGEPFPAIQFILGCRSRIIGQLQIGFRHPPFLVGHRSAVCQFKRTVNPVCG